MSPPPQEARSVFDAELYQHVLGLTARWRVAEVKLDVESTQIHVHVEHAEGSLWPCPQCQKELACYDHAPKRNCRHLSTCHYQTLVHARIRSKLHEGRLPFGGGDFR